MSKSTSTKSKPPPWIPPGKGTPQYKKRSKPIIKSKKDDSATAEVSPEVSPQWHTVNISKKEASRDIDTDLISLSSHSSYEIERLSQENEINIQHVAFLQEVKLLYMHFASLKTSFLSAHRLIESEDIENSNVNELFIEAGSSLKRLNALFDDLEYSVSVFENTLNENEKKTAFSTVLKNKEKLLSTLLEMYDKVVLIFQFAFEKQGFKELSRVQESLNEKLKKAERKCSSQEAVIIDLERRLSIYESKIAAMESYKTNLESAKVELQKTLLHKESQIKYLNSELMNASEKHTKSDREDFIEIIEVIKSKAHNEKSALKKTLKLLKTQAKEKEETYKKLLDEVNEKEEMMMKLAAQRDQLKVQLTVVNNNVIQLKHQIEEMKIQNSKLQSEMTEKDKSHEKEVLKLKSSIEEKSAEFDESLKRKKKLEETIIELENKLKKTEANLETAKDEFDASKQLNSHVSSKDIPQLVALLQNTRETFENLVQSQHFMSASGDHVIKNTEFGNIQEEILSAISEIKKHILELRNQLLTFLHDEKDVTEPKSLLKGNDLEKQFKKLEHLYKSTLKENESLRQKLEDFRCSNLPASSAVENHVTSDISSDSLVRKHELELYKKNSEIANLKFELAQRERDLENYLRESKDKLRILEINEAKISSLEEELKSTKLELAVLQRKKEEEITSVLQRAQELQESLDKKTDECRNLEQYIQLIRASYFKVFGNS